MFQDGSVLRLYVVSTIGITVSFISGKVGGMIYRSFVSFVCHQLTETFFKELTSELVHIDLEF